MIKYPAHSAVSLGQDDVKECMCTHHQHYYCCYYSILDEWDTRQTRAGDSKCIFFIDNSYAGLCLLNQCLQVYWLFPCRPTQEETLFLSNFSGENRFSFPPQSGSSSRDCIWQQYNTSPDMQVCILCCKNLYCDLFLTYILLTRHWVENLVVFFRRSRRSKLSYLSREALTLREKGFLAGKWKVTAVM